MTKAHKHCWHAGASWWNGLGTTGGETRQCCHCGLKQRRNVHAEKHPRHGIYADVTVVLPSTPWEDAK